MQRMVLLAVLAALTVLQGCAGRDPNLTVRGMNEFTRAPGDYTLNLRVYDLDEKGHARGPGLDDASLRGFVSRTLAARGYTLKTAGPAAYALDVHLLCADMRQASMSFVTEQVPVPAEALAPGASSDVYYWLPDREAPTGQTGQETQDRRDSLTGRREGRATLDGAPMARRSPDFCQGRVLVALAPAAQGPAREVFVARAATGDCKAVPGCPVNTCRDALEQALVELLERRL